jgi:ribosomal protein L11 methyltransferase
MPPPKEGWQRSVIKALFATQTIAYSAASTLALQDFFENCQSLGITEVADQDWVRLTQSQFAPVEITPEFWIVPTWHQAPAGARKVITLDPGLAFGTGTHPTTRMCLRWIAEHGVQGQRVLDYGCGSGILAIGAALHGALDIDAVDIDEAAVRSTQGNALANHVTLQAGLPDAAQGQYHTVLANILATPLKVLAQLLCNYVQKAGQEGQATGRGVASPTGNLVLAGILERQADELKAAYAPYAQLEVSDSEDGWILMTAKL